jgi:hypothetical protein
MRYFCSRCGKIVTESEAIKDPDEDIECESCYLANKDEWFSDEEETEEEPEDLKPGTHELTGAIEKKSFWRR